MFVMQHSSLKCLNSYYNFVSCFIAKRRRIDDIEEDRDDDDDDIDNSYEDDRVFDRYEH